MAYKVLIVDDEEIMRDGLANLVDWESMGYVIADKLEDGRNAIEFIQKTTVDVILTDIKMTFVSGIELAKYIVDNNLNIKVVLISGFQEFEFARQAMKYNVNHYLLKPPRFKDIQAVFDEIRIQLDIETQIKLQEIKKTEQYLELLDFSKEQFFIDLVFGAVNGSDEIKSKLQLLNLDTNLEVSPCSIINITINDFENFVNSNWDYGKEGIYSAIKNFLKTNDASLLFYPIRNIKEKMQFLCIQTELTGRNIFSQKLEKHLMNVKINIKGLLNLDLSFEIERNFDSLIELAKGSYFNSLTERLLDYDVKEIGNDNESTRLLEQVKLLATHISTGNYQMSESMFEHFLDQVKDFDFNIIQNFISDLFEMLQNKLCENGIEIEHCVGDKNYFSEVHELDQIEKIRSWGKNRLKAIVGKVEKSKSNPYGNAVNKAKLFIKENYNKDITLEDIADHIFLNPVYFSRLFKEQTGENYIDYLIKIRMEKAVTLLQDSRYKVLEISNMVGYESIRYFYKIFKRYKGQTPTEYRKSLWGEDEAT